MTVKAIKCATCSVEIDPLAVFPGTICVDCYAVSPEGRRPLNARDIVSMWGGDAPVEYSRIFPRN